MYPMRGGLFIKGEDEEIWQSMEFPPLLAIVPCGGK